MADLANTAAAICRWYGWSVDAIVVAEISLFPSLPPSLSLALSLCLSSFSPPRSLLLWLPLVGTENQALWQLLNFSFVPLLAFRLCYSALTCSSHIDQQLA